jgi:EAL domain-containing protein (putative c-di-GMP-specific phosphodiesterase class I)
VIKLDRSVVAGVASDPVLRRLIGSMVGFAHGGDARVVAEGVETADDAAALLELGVDDGQGWLFGRPGPPEALGAPPAREDVTAPR